MIAEQAPKTVRCHTDVASPFLRANIEVFEKVKSDYIWKQKNFFKEGNRNFRKFSILDLGAGNGRNMYFVRDRLRMAGPALGLDRDPVEGVKYSDLGVDTIPVNDGTVDVILCQYLLMFMKPEERLHLMKEIERVAASGAAMLVELFPAKSGLAPCAKSLQPVAYQTREFFTSRGWTVSISNPFHFFLHKP